MKKLFLILAIALGVGTAQAAQQSINYATRTNWSTEGAKVQANFTELYSDKANKVDSGLKWDAWPVGTPFTASSPPVWYNGVWYECIASYTKSSGDTPDLLTVSFAPATSASGGGGTAATTTFTPFSTITSLDTQAAIQELYAEAALETEVITKGSTTPYIPLTSNDPVPKGYVDAQVIAAGGYNDEQAQDAFVSALSAGTMTGLSMTYNDSSNSLSLSLNSTYMSTYYQAKDADLDAIAALTTTAYGRGILDDTTASQAVTTLGFGTSALQTVGTAIGNVVGLVDNGSGAAALPFSISYNDLDNKPTSTTIGGLFSGGDLYLKRDGTTGPGGTGGGGSVSTIGAVPYSDIGCTSHGYYSGNLYVCVDGFYTQKVALTAHSNPAPAGSSDTFNRADGSLGGSWASAQSLLTNLTIASNLVTTTSDWNAGGGRYSSITNDVSQAVMKGNSPAGLGRGEVCVRMSSSENGYCLRLTDKVGSNYTTAAVSKNGVWLCDVGALSYADTVDHTVKITASGTSTVAITGVVDGTTVIGSCSDTSSTITSGNPGIILSADGSPRPQVDTWQAY